MKPKNKFQARVVEVSKRLPKLTQTQIQWAYNNVIEQLSKFPVNRYSSHDGTFTVLFYFLSIDIE